MAALIGLAVAHDVDLIGRRNVVAGGELDSRWLLDPELLDERRRLARRRIPPAHGTSLPHQRGRIPLP